MTPKCIFCLKSRHHQIQILDVWFFVHSLNVKYFLLGASIRLDTTLVDFNEMKWERGDITFLYKGDATQSKDSFFILDNKLGVYQRVRRFKNLMLVFRN